MHCVFVGLVLSPATPPRSLFSPVSESWSSPAQRKVWDAPRGCQVVKVMLFQSSQYFSRRSPSTPSSSAVLLNVVQGLLQVHVKEHIAQSLHGKMSCRLKTVVFRAAQSVVFVRPSRYSQARNICQYSIKNLFHSIVEPVKIQLCIKTEFYCITSDYMKR